MTTMLRANFRGYDPTLAEDVWTIRGLFQVDGSGKIEVTEQGSISVDVDWETAGETGRPMSSIMRNTVVLGGYANAIKGYMDCDGGGGSTGLLSGINGEIRLPDAAGAGAYYCLEGEMVFQTSSTITPWGSDAGFLYFGASGAGIADFDTDGKFMLITGLTPGTGKLLSLDMHTLKTSMVVDGTHYAKYLVQSIAENYISHSFSALAADGNMAKFVGANATPAYNDGYSAFEIELNVSGVATGIIAASSTWVNLTGEGHAHNYEGIMVRNDGIWEDVGGKITDVPIFYGGRFQAILGDTDFSQLCFASINLSQKQTSLFAVNSEGNFGYTAGEHSSAVVGSIPFYSLIDGTGIKYIRVYNTAA